MALHDDMKRMLIVSKVWQRYFEPMTPVANIGLLEVGPINVSNYFLYCEIFANGYIQHDSSIGTRRIECPACQSAREKSSKLYFGH